MAKDISRKRKHQDGQISVAELLAKHRAQIRDQDTGGPVRRTHVTNTPAGMVGDFPTAELSVGDLLRREGRGDAAVRPVTGRARQAVGAIAVTAGATVLSAAILAGAAAIVGGKQQGPQAAKDLIIGEQALQPNAIGAAIRTAQWSTTAAISYPALSTQHPGVSGATPAVNSAENPSAVAGPPRGSANSQRTVSTAGDPTPTSPSNGPSANGPSTNGPSTNGPSTNGPSTDGPSADGSTATSPDPIAATTTSAQPPTADQATTPGTPVTSGSGPLAAITEVADSFFATAPTDPTTAFSLLAPEMQTGGLREFKASWQGVRAATVEKLVPDGNHAARISVLYAWEDGRRVRTEQRLVVSGGAVAHIKDATVLSVRGG